MKLLHTSDWHLGRALTNNRTFAQEQMYFFDKLYAILAEEQIDAVLVAGDVYDSSVSNAEAINLYNEVVTTICLRMGVPAVVIAGNHDSGPRLAACRDLLRGAGLYVTGRIGADLSPAVFGDVAVYALPYFNKDEVIALFPEEKAAITSTAAAMQVLCDHIRAGMDPNKKNILVAHALIQNVELSDSDHSAQIGTASAISKDVFDGFDYVALGHIHKPQQVSDRIRYAGSPVIFSFGREETQEKGVVILDTDTMTQRFVPVGALHGRRTVEGTHDEILAMDGLENDYLKLIVTDRVNSAALYRECKEKFPLLLELSGAEAAVSGEGTSLNARDLKRLDAFEILTGFMNDRFGMDPDAEQRAFFEAALREADREVAEN